MRDLQGAGADSLGQARTGCGALLPPGFRLGQGQGGLDLHLSTWPTAGWRVAVGCEGKGKRLVRTGEHHDGGWEAADSP